MLPVATSIAMTPATTPLVNTAMPGTAVVHPPYDNVAPSLSNAEVNNNARGNGAVPSPAEQPPSDTSAANDNTFLGLITGNGQSLGMAQATFLAQMLAQDNTPVTQRFLVEYQRIINLGNVKYKPSNALKPLPGPMNMFGKILHEQASTASEAAPTPVPAPAQPQQETVVTAPTPEPAKEPPQQPVAEAPVAELAPAAEPLPPQAVSAYASSATRIPEATPVDKIVELV